jgi:hypothetical protein
MSIIGFSIFWSQGKKDQKTFYLKGLEPGLPDGIFLNQKS